MFFFCLFVCFNNYYSRLGERSELDGITPKNTKFDRHFGVKLQVKVMPPVSGSLPCEWDDFHMSKHVTAQSRESCFRTDEEALQFAEDFGERNVLGKPGA